MGLRGRPQGNPVVAQFVIEAARRICEIEADAQACGLTNLYIDTDFLKYREHCERVGVHAHKEFDPAISQILPDSGFWIHGERAGETVHLQAMRLDDLGTSTLAEFFRLVYTQVYDAEITGSCPAAEEISGRVAYHGGLWLHPDLRGDKVGLKLCRYGILTAFLRWHPDFIVGWATKRTGLAGMTKLGYFRLEPLVLSWKGDAPFPPYGWLCWNSNKAMRHSVRLPSEQYD